MADVVGVVSDVKHRALDETVMPTVYLSALQAPSRSNIIVVRTSYPDADVIAAVREEVARLDGMIPVYRVRSMQDVVASSSGMPTRRLLTATFAGFALLAAALGAIGLFGVVTHDVASRRSELALRIALGADPIRILTVTLSRGAAMIGWGVIVGAVLSIWTARAFVAAGFAANQIDALSIGLPALLSIMVGAAAILPAARRAAHTDPLIALRSE
jgi:putative ABC transport system permease protein